MMAILEKLPVSSRPHWQLYVDWCEARGIVPVPASVKQLATYAQEVPAAFSTTVARIRAIRIAHELAGALFPYPAPSPVPAVRSGKEWASIPDAIAAVPVTRYPVGLVGRRDAFVLLLLDLLRLSRRQAGAVSVAEVDPDRWFIAGVELLRTDPAATCARCVLSRWLRVLGPAALGRRLSAAEVLDPGLHTESHDCDEPLDAAWTSAPVLLPAIDQHGWLDNHRPLSIRTISAITATRQDPTVEPADNYPKSRTRRDTPAMSLREVADAHDDLDERVAALLLHTRDLLAQIEAPAPATRPVTARLERED
ncbi:hypothetical protein HQQ80_18965 [Microbacteriaceae bacterium VKM Ac-2855]|nr:hypothetical protein [Microbacteriaceae bacterium VKM Ac-2855]